MKNLLTVVALCYGLSLVASPIAAQAQKPSGDAERGRLEFGACRTCHYAEAIMGHNNGLAHFWGICL